MSIGGRPVSGRSVGSAIRSPLPLTLLGVWRAFWAEPWSFKFTCLYVFFEYVRPQEVYEWLTVLPWSRVTILSAVFFFVIEGGRVRSRSVANGLLLCFALVVLLSSVFAYSPTESFNKLVLLLNWLIAFFLISNTASDERKFYLFIVLFLLWCIKMSQFATRSFLTGGGSSGGAPGWFQNTGEFALQMCIFVPLSLFFLIGLYPSLKKSQVIMLSLLPLSGVIGVVNSGSRGGLLGLGCVGLWLLLKSKRKVRGLIVLAVAAPTIWAILPQAQRDRFSTAGKDETSVSRLTYWKRGLDMASKYPVLGVGYENWGAYIEDHYPLAPGEVRKYVAPGISVVEVSHNIFIEVVSQLGYTGLVLFVLLIVSIWFLNAKSRRVLRSCGERGRFLENMSHGLDAGNVGFIVAGFFMAVAFNPFLWFQLAMTAALHVVALQLANRTNMSTRTHHRRPQRSERAHLHVPAGFAKI